MLIKKRLKRLTIFTMSLCLVLTMMTGISIPVWAAEASFEAATGEELSLTFADLFGSVNTPNTLESVSEPTDGTHTADIYFGNIENHEEIFYDTSGWDYHFQSDEIFTFIADYEGVYTFTCYIRVDFGDLETRTIQVTVTGGNTAPTGISLDNTTAAENTAVGTVVGTLTTTDVDADDTFTYSLISGTGDDDNDSFNINGNELQLAVTPDYEMQDSYSIRIQTKDSGNETYQEVFTITVTDENDAPVISSGTTASVVENTETTTVIYTATGSDPDGDTVTWSISGTDAALFSIDGSTGTVTFNNSPDYENPSDNGTDNIYNITITAMDDGMGTLTDTQDVAITVTNINETPTVTSGATINFEENETGTVYTATASDPDNGETITWSIGGIDALLFSINNSTGVVTFNSVPNYESPEDNGTDNVYNIIVNAVDDSTSTLTATKDVAITVTDIAEAPEITLTTTVSFKEGGTGTVYTATGTDDDGNTIIWSIGGTDKDIFTIDNSTGVLTFVSTPNYSSPSDSDTDNVYDITVIATDNSAEALSSSIDLAITVTKKSSHSGDSSSSLGTDGASVEVNGESYTAGESKTGTNEDGRTQTTVTVDTDKLQEILEEQGEMATVTIPFSTDNEVSMGVLTGEMVDHMEENGATLVIKKKNATYTLPADEIDINAVSEQFGDDVSLSDIKVTVEIAEPSNDTVTVVENAAEEGGYSIVVPAVDFTISCEYNETTIEVSSFNSYIERLIAIPDGVDPEKITTGVVVKADGTTYHVPTEIVEIDGVYYAKINSLTNSTYIVVWHPVEFIDVEGHWAQDAINDMGSRMVVYGNKNGDYNPDNDMTRAEFAATIVRALGLPAGTGKIIFDDVSSSDWYCGYVETASEYGIVTGYGNDMFGPNDTITREQAMTMIARAMEITGLEVSLSDSEIEELLGAYSDGIAISNYAMDNVAACIQTGIVSGNDDNTIAPKDYVTRAEVAVMVKRLLQKSELI